MENYLRGNMVTRITHPATPPASSDHLKNWVMVVLTPVFVSLYGAALVGWCRPLADDKLVVRLEPFLVIIGYYFGRRDSKTKRLCPQP